MIRCSVEVVHVPTGRNKTDETQDWLDNLKYPKLNRNSIGFSGPNGVSWVLRVD